MAATQAREIKKLPTLRGRTVVNLFFEDSTRTRISFETAAKRLSADVINFSAKGSSVSKGESLKDTALTLQAMGADAVVIRHHASGAPHTLATSGWTHGAVINAGDGMHQHPTQALLDAYTLRRHLAGPGDVTGRDLTGLRIAIVGDVLHSRVARSNVHLLHTLGAEVMLVAPPTLLPVGVGAWPCRVSYHLDEVLADEKPDAVMMLRVQRERMSSAGGGFFPSPLEYTRRYGLDARRLAAAARARDRAAPRADEPRPGDLGGRRGLHARGDRRAGGQRRGGPHGRPVPAARGRRRPRSSGRPEHDRRDEGGRVTRNYLLRDVSPLGEGTTDVLLADGVIAAIGAGRGGRRPVPTR